MHEPLPHRSAPATGVAHTLHRDYETRSNANLPKIGVDKYAADPSTEVLCAAYAVDDGRSVVAAGPRAIPAVFFEAERDPNWRVSATTTPSKPQSSGTYWGPLRLSVRPA
jgi:hypothetical protein